MADLFDLAPKVELHLHLEGAIPLATLWDLIEGYGGDPSVPNRDALQRRFIFSDFLHFIDTWRWMTGFVRSEDDFVLIAEGVARQLESQNIVYAEASFSPTDFERHGLTPQQIGLAIRRGLDRVPGTRVVLNVDLVRDTGPDRAARTLASVLEIAHEADVRGITIGGPEQSHPPAPFAEIYRHAAAAGMRLTAHAGEAAGPESVWSALQDLGAERIGHGVRSVEDPALLRHLVERQVPLEVCPTSNICTGIAPDWDGHQIHRLLEAGANITINSDDPTFFNCTLAGELRLLGSADRVLGLTQSAIAASWLDTSERAPLSEAVHRWWAER